MEGMACGIPQIVPDWAALGEWTTGAALKVPCTEIACTPNMINVVGGIPSRRATIEALDLLYRDRNLRSQYSKAGLELVHRQQYRWEEVGQSFADAIEMVLQPVKTYQEEAVKAHG
jgi:glycosyltransferase involved in cell wall biosynthesis